MVRDERLGTRATGDLVHHGRLNLEEAQRVKVPTHVLDRTRTRHENVAHMLIHDQVQVPLAVSLFLVRKATARCLWQHLEVRREQLDGMWHNRQLALLRLGRHTLDTDDVTTAQQVVRLEEVALPVILHLCHDLDLDALSVQVVETQLLPRCTHVVQAACHAHYICELCAWFDLVLETRNKVCQAQCYVEFVRIRIRVPCFAQLLNRSAAHLIVLVRRQCFFGRHVSACLRCTTCATGAAFRLRLGGLLGLFGVLLPLLLPALQLALADHFAGHWIRQ